MSLRSRYPRALHRPILSQQLLAAYSRTTWQPHSFAAISRCSRVRLPPPKYRNTQAANHADYPKAD